MPSYMRCCVESGRKLFIQYGVELKMREKLNVFCITIVLTVG